MTTLLLNSDPVALWQDIIHEAEAASTISLKTELESYLVFLLIRYTNRPEMAKKIIANEFLKGMELSNKQRQNALQTVGDNCLLYSGLFPKVSERRHVKISYFVNLGQASYIAISQRTNDLYELLANHFVPLMDVLQSIRQYSKAYPDLLPLQAYELWNETGSQRAFKALKQYTQATSLPVILRAAKDL